MTRPNLGYSNYYWIRQDQKRLKKLEAQRTKTERTTQTNTPAESLEVESLPESTGFRGETDEEEAKTEDSGIFSSGEEEIPAASPDISAAAPEIPVETPNKPQDSWALTTASQTSVQSFASWSKNVQKD